jgi:signal transduction histidine kinase
VQSDPGFDEIKLLRRSINDLVGLVALPAVWSGGEPSQIARTLLDALFGMLNLDLVYVRLNVGDAPVEMARVAQAHAAPAPQDVIEVLGRWLERNARLPVARVSNLVGARDITVVPLRLGLQGEMGLIVVGSQRPDFPLQTERLLLSVASNQAAVGLHEVRLLNEQQRIADELDRRIGQRTMELAAANEELKQEIAERRFAEEKLRRSEAFLTETQQVSLTGSLSWRIPSDEITWSEQVYRIFEFEPGSPVTLERIASRVHPEDSTLLFDMIDRARSAGSNLESEYRLLMPDRSVKFVHLVAHATWDRGGGLEYLGAVQDVTQRRLSEDALGKARSELAYVSRVTTLGALTASIAHEVNQPLSGIITNASTCLRMLASDPPNLDGARETARRTIRDGNRASDVITRLRALFARKAALAEWVDLNEATREVIALSREELSRAAVVLRPELADDLPRVPGDRVQLQQVVLNLLLNASDAMAGIEDRPRQLLVATQRDDDGWVRLSVRDSGVGLEPGGADKLFEAFYTTKSHGMGIGLAVSRSIIESHRGRLWATANDGPGATFSFSIPCGAESTQVS